MKPSEKITELILEYERRFPLETNVNKKWVIAITAYLDWQYAIKNSTDSMLRGTPPAKKKAAKGKKVAKKAKKVVKAKKK